MGLWKVISIIIEIAILIFMLLVGLYILFTLIDWLGVKGTIVTMIFLLLIMAAAFDSANSYEYEHTPQTHSNKGEEIREKYEYLVGRIKHELTTGGRLSTTDIPWDILENLEREGYLQRDRFGVYKLIREDEFLDSAIKRSVKKHLAYWMEGYSDEYIDKIIDEF